MDGFARMATVLVRVLEVKCAFSVDNENVTTVHPVTLADNPKYILEKRAGQPKLKSKHTYYNQVQGVLGMYGMIWCDFVIWTEGGLFDEKITFDGNLLQSVISELTQFYYKHGKAKLLCCRLQVTT